jgi:hypothetical protein
VFECKNWNSKVGKNEIIVFAEKVDAVSAAKGYFVATAYTEDAKAQAEKHTRLRLLLASEVHFTTPVPVAMPIVCRQQPHQANFTVKWWDVEGKNIRQLDRPTVTLNGKTSSFEAFFQPLAQEALNAAFDNFDDRGKEEGIYDTSAEMTEEYPRGVLFI